MWVSSILAETLSHSVENGADDSADDSGLRGLLPLSRHVRCKLVSEAGNGQRLQPNASGAGESGEKDSVAAEDHVADAGDAGDLEGDAGRKGSDVSRMHPQHLAGREVFGDNFARKLDPRDALAGDVLQEESVAAEDARAERLLEANSDVDLRCGT